MQINFGTNFQSILSQFELFVNYLTTLWDIWPLYMCSNKTYNLASTLVQILWITPWSTWADKALHAKLVVFEYTTTNCFMFSLSNLKRKRKRSDSKGRFRSDSYKIRNNSKRKYKNFLYHFIKYNHSIEHVKITPVEILSKLSGESKNDMKKRRLSAELNWIKRLQTPYPLGLNDQIYQQGNISSICSNINIFSLKPEVRRKRRSHGVRRNGLSRRKQRLNRSLDDLLRIAKNNGRHELLHALSSIPVSRLKPILDEADRRSLRHSDWFKLKIIMAFSFNKLFPRVPSLPPKTQFIKIKFINQGLDLLNISNIFRDHRVISKIPQYFENLDPPLICYQYKKPIRNIIFNYNQVTSDPDVINSIQSSWSCADSPFLYPPAGHVVTGDLNCIHDKGLRSLFEKGPKYRLPSRIDFTKCRSIVEEALQSYCKRWCKKENVGVHALNDWKNEFLRIIDIRI